MLLLELSFALRKYISPVSCLLFTLSLILKAVFQFQNVRWKVRNAAGLRGIGAAYPRLSSPSCEWLTAGFTLYFGVDAVSVPALPGSTLRASTSLPWHSLSRLYSLLQKLSRIAGWVRRLS